MALPIGGGGGGLGGVWLSYVLNASSGGMIGVALGIEFALAYVFGPHGALRRG